MGSVSLVGVAIAQNHRAHTSSAPTHTEDSTADATLSLAGVMMVFLLLLNVPNRGLSVYDVLGKSVRAQGLKMVDPPLDIVFIATGCWLTVDMMKASRVQGMARDEGKEGALIAIPEAGGF